MSFQIIARVEDPSLARVLIAALRAHCFHPLEDGEGGLPGFTEPFFGKGVPIRLPEEEVEDGRLLAQDLLTQMSKG